MNKPNHLRNKTLIQNEINNCERIEHFREAELHKELEILKYIEYLEDEFKMMSDKIFELEQEIEEMCD